ncbi:MAG: hypothetical protein ACJAQT_004964 [Akkermansiaceae bacterium]|jgi:hypothetical protein
MRRKRKKVGLIWRFFRVFGRKGTPYLALLSTVFVIVGLVICWCRPAILGVASKVGGGTRSSYGKNSGSIIAGDECGAGGDFAILLGLLFLAIGTFLFVVGYRVTNEDES